MDNLTFDNLTEPYSLESEQAVLGSVLIDPQCLSDVMTVLKAEHFYIPQHRDIYSVIVTLDALGSKIDPLIVLEELKKNEVYNDADGKNYLAQLAQAVPSTANVMNYAKIVKEKFTLRELMTVSHDVLHQCSEESENAETILDSAEQRIYNIRQGKTTDGPTKLGDIVINDVIPNVTLLSTPEGKDRKGIPTGFSVLDKYMTGLNKSDLILIGARPAMGKTSFALNIARNAAVTSRKKVLFFSLEMSKEQLAQRILATEARIESSKMRTGDISPEEWVRIATCSDALSKAELYFDDTSNITVPEMKARVRRLKDVDLVVIDYLQLMTGTKRTDNRAQEVAEITRSLKLMAKDLKIPVVTCSQLNRQSASGKGKDHKPTMSELRESGSIEQDADIILLLYRESYFDEDKGESVVADENKAQVIIAKNRHGGTTDVDLNWNGQYTLFTTAEYNRNEP